MRLIGLGLLLSAGCAVSLAHAFHRFRFLFPTLIYLLRTPLNVCLWVAMFMWMLVMVGVMLKGLLFGDLRLIEREVRLPGP